MTDVKTLQRQLPAIQRLKDERRWKELQEKVTGLARDAQRLGFDSAYLAWCLALAHDELGETVAALDAISRAALLDAAHPAITRLFREVCDHARERLCAEEPGSQHIAELHERLSRIGEADVECHLARARYALAQGDTALAVKLVDAVLVLTPACLAACELRHEIATRAGDPAADTFASMAVEARLAASTFGVPGAKVKC